MRYENWDVLLFPEGSKVPIQEFKTQCFVIKDRESPYLHFQNHSVLSPGPFYPGHGNGSAAQIPVLTAFVPSLSQGSPFRVSVHSWDRPRPSRRLEGLMQPEDVVLYEVRIFIDGLCVSGSIFGQMTVWPHVINQSSQIDKNGNQDHLRFPPFHSEILHQSHWDAGESHGRIRVVISEGLSRPHRSPPFERVKDIIALAFQHAPLHVLEQSNIAWPNPGMWCQGPRNMFKYHSESVFSDTKDIEDAHAHSPARHETRTSGTGSSINSSAAMYSTWPYRLFPPPTTQWQGGLRDSRWASNDLPMPDPFMEPYMTHRSSRRAARSTLEDVPMPDYVGSSSTSSRAISNMTGVSFEHSKHPSISASADDETYGPLIDAFGPSKPRSSGTFAPTNTPASIPPMASRPSAAAEARSASYSTKNGSRTSVLKEVSQPGTRDVSGSSTRSGPVDSLSETVMGGRLQVSPSPKVKGKKERKSLQDNKENESSEPSSRDVSRGSSIQPRVVLRSGGASSVSSDSKRKRSGGLTGDTQVSKDDASTPSPTKKVTRVGEHSNDDQIVFDDLLDPRAHEISEIE
ncbi:hypothetical protein AOR_1_1022074 [Paecilomyces variotii No. 5]|uniref:Uncharacterized protein n=1 Tax=Byssochlamys spectabilis (strain No. 5 / NBRC 109023) TaxID=1356009 RepID=V5G6M9_BYSSN|nr:hypothetical protein AOR_1_1022074 [Paecilomyces variotii No. 5]